MKRIHSVTVLLLALIVVLGATLVIGQRREARLREALAVYKGRAQDELRSVMGSRLAPDWPDGTPLREVVERVADSPPPKSRWRSHFPRGLPILVDLDGLREAGRTLDSPVGAPPPDLPTGWPVSLRGRLEAVLGPLGLAAEVREGAIVITARGRVRMPADASEEEGEP
jgi:hypothetical protein